MHHSFQSLRSCVSRPQTEVHTTQECELEAGQPDLPQILKYSPPMEGPSCFVSIPTLSMWVGYSMAYMLAVVLGPLSQGASKQ
jgi:hypothetical protein